LQVELEQCVNADV